MSKITVKKVADMQSYNNEGHFVFSGKSLGVTAFGLNTLNLKAHWDGYPQHNHSTDFPDHQEEVYIVISGSGTMEADGESINLEPGVYVHVPADVTRKILPGGEGISIIAVGATPGKAYQPK